ncbi:MAG: hypothetical protein P1U84_02455 [Parvibaculaceae bacterium]|nr:hypothetical protein [Parvibaculaceae bacterium]|tara:strand:+ start:368 stop:499 length:132 start_codon:yes stop_codon:yes gene_type:complete
MRKLRENEELTRWFQDVAALVSVAAMGWTVLVWGRIAESLISG